MLNYCITYLICSGLFTIAWFQGKVVVPGNEGGILHGVGSFFAGFFLRGWIISFVTLAGWMNRGWGAEGYARWWYEFNAFHSTALWFLTTPVVTLGLWIVWRSTLKAMTTPGAVGWWSEGAVPSLHKISMRVPMVWFLVLWAWLLLSPTLPFFTCYVRIFVLRTPLPAAFE